MSPLDLSRFARNEGSLSLHSLIGLWRLSSTLDSRIGPATKRFSGRTPSGVGSGVRPAVSITRDGVVQRRTTPKRPDTGPDSGPDFVQ